MRDRLFSTILLSGILFIFSIKDGCSQKIRCGFSGGVIASQVDGDRMGGYHKFGGHVGVFARTPIQKNLWFDMHLLFIQKGSRPSGKNTTESIVIDTRYVDFEVFLLYKLRQSFYLKAGLVPGVCIHSSITSLSGVEQAMDVPFRKANLGAIIGAEYEFSKHFSLFLDFGYSLLSIRKGKIGMHDYHFAFQNGQFHNYMKLGIHYTF